MRTTSDDITPRPLRLEALVLLAVHRVGAPGRGRAGERTYILRLVTNMSLEQVPGNEQCVYAVLWTW